MTTTEQSYGDVADVAPIGHEEGMSLFSEEMKRHLDLMRSLTADDWMKKTECPAWDCSARWCPSSWPLRRLARRTRSRSLAISKRRSFIDDRVCLPLQGRDEPTLVLRAILASERWPHP
jgi:hypothetical protein